MSAWKKGLKDAPKDKPIPAKFALWKCLCVIQYTAFEEEKFWVFVDPTLQDIDGSVHDDIVDEVEWAEIPE